MSNAYRAIWKHRRIYENVLIFHESEHNPNISKRKWEKIAVPWESEREKNRHPDNFDACVRMTSDRIAQSYISITKSEITIHAIQTKPKICMRTQHLTRTKKIKKEQAENGTNKRKKTTNNYHPTMCVRWNSINQQVSLAAHIAYSILRLVCMCASYL